MEPREREKSGVHPVPVPPPLVLIGFVSRWLHRNVAKKLLTPPVTSAKQMHVTDQEKDIKEEMG